MNEKNVQTNTALQLGQGVNRITGVGILAEKDLQFKNSSKVGDFVMGTLTLRTNSGDVKFNVFAKKLTKAGAVSKSYKAFETIHKEFKSIADTGDANTADVVSVLGELTQEKPYLGQDGKAKQPVKKSGKFFSREDRSKVQDLNIYLEADVFIQTVAPETNRDGEETGRAIINGILVGYNSSLVQQKFIVDNPEGVEFFLEAPTNSTVHLNQVKLTQRIEVKESNNVQSEGGWGVQSTLKTFTNTYNEAIVLGAKVPVEFDEDLEDNMPQLAFNPKLITQALAVRKEQIESLENGGGQSNTKVGFGIQAPKQDTGFGNPYTSNDDDYYNEDSLPF